MSISRRWWTVLVAVWFLASCAGDDGPSGPDPNEPFPYSTPPSSILTIDTTHLTSQEIAPQEGLCHALSGLVVFWIDANVVFRLAIPIGALGACLVREPVYLGDLTWRWTASGGTGMLAHTDELTAKVLGEGQVAWQMRVTGTQHELDRFLWFEGETDTTSQHGEWYFYDYMRTAEQIETVRIDWTYDSLPGGSVSLEIENVDPDSDYYRDLLRSEVIGTESSLVLFDWEADSSGTTTIRWDRVDGDGMTVNAAGDSCCWASAEEQYQDIPCSK